MPFQKVAQISSHSKLQIYKDKKTIRTVTIDDSPAIDYKGEEVTYEELNN